MIKEYICKRKPMDEGVRVHIKQYEIMKKSISIANEREITNSRQNLVIIDETIKKESDIMRGLSDKLTDQYEDGDRRAEKCEAAVLALDSAILALETLRRYEEETITMCNE